jgi:hypothetical protein
MRGGYVPGGELKTARQWSIDSIVEQSASKASHESPLLEERERSSKNCSREIDIEIGLKKSTAGIPIVTLELPGSTRKVPCVLRCAPS